MSRLFSLLISVAVAVFVISGDVSAQGTDQWQIWREACIKAGNAPVTLADEPLTFSVWQSPDDEVYKQYTLVIKGRVLGRTRGGDAIKIVVSQAGKDLLTLRKGLKGINPDELQYCEDFEFDANHEGNVLTATGDLTLTFKYYNDQDESERVIGVRKVKIVKLAQHMGSFKHVWKFGILTDDLAGSSYAYLTMEDEYSTPRVWFYSWMNLEDENLNDVSVRVEVDGKRLELPNDFLFAVGDIDGFTQEEELYLRNVDGNYVANKYNWTKKRWAFYMYWGQKRENVTDNFIAMIDHPGKWVIKIKNNGKLARELRFTVTPDGQIAAHPEQDPSKPGALNLGPGRYFVETYFGNPNEVDSRFNPTAVAAGMMHGRAWISDEVKNGMLKALPPAVPGPHPFPTTTLPSSPLKKPPSERQHAEII